MTEKVLNTITDLLSSPRKIVIVGHKNPDGDAIGSCLGLYFFLKNRGHHATVVMPNDFPDFLKWLPGCEQILQFERQTPATKKAIVEADLIFTLDFNALDRTGDLGTELGQLSTPFVLIDHHQQPEDYALASYSDVSMSSTAEMVYHLIEAMHGQLEVNKEIATNLYMGIMTDTGSFRYPSTSAVTHRVIAHLIDSGANPSEIHQNIYDTHSVARMKLLGVALDNMVVIQELRTAYICLTQDELDACNFKKGDTEGFVNYPLSVQGIVFSVIFIENKLEGIVKLSLRSKGNFNVNEFARNHYNGGGHVNASGGRSSLSLSDTVKEFISILPLYKNALHHDS